MTAALAFAPAPAAASGDRTVLDEVIERADALLTRAEACTFALALDDAGGLELPPAVASGATDQAHLRAVATLYLAAELESALVVPVAELLAGLAVSGGLPGDVGAAAAPLAAFWRSRSERFAPEERVAFFARLFGAAAQPLAGGGPVNAAFDERLIDLCEALYKLDEGGASGGYGAMHQQVRLRMAANAMIDNVVQHSGGMTAFAAREMLAGVRAAVAILATPALQRRFGGDSLWDVVRSVAARYLHDDPAIDAHVTRGKAGLTILAWLADALPALADGGGPLIGLDHPVVGAAVEWLQASLSLQECASESSRGA